MTSLRALSLLLALLFVVTGCDAVAPGTDSPDNLVEDAVIAREQGDYDTAVDLLENAIQADPTSSPARVELGVTLLERDGVDLFDLERAARSLTGQISGASQRAGADLAACTFGDNPAAEEFDPTDYPEYAQALEVRQTLEDIRDTFESEDIGVMPDGLRAVNLCTGVEEGQLVYDHDAILAEMRDAGLSAEQIDAALAVNAVTLMLDGVFTVLEDLSEEQNVRWYRIPNGDGTYTVGICADDLDALQAGAEATVADFGEALVSLELRSYHIVQNGGSPDALSQDVVEAVMAAYAEVEDDLANYCASREA